MTNIEIVSKVIFENQLYVLPLYSINQNKECTCNNKECGAPGKHPLFRYNWKIIASNNPEKIQNWFQAYNKMDFDKLTESVAVSIIRSVILKIEEYISTINPSKTVIIAFDGVAPVAKLEQQRSRRYKSWFQNEITRMIFNKE